MVGTGLLGSMPHKRLDPKTALNAPGYKQDSWLRSFVSKRDGYTRYGVLKSDLYCKQSVQFA